MTLYVNIDNFQQENFKPFASHTSVFSLEEPDTVSGLINLPKPIIATISNFLYSGKRPIPANDEVRSTSVDEMIQAWGY